MNIRKKIIPSFLMLAFVLILNGCVVAPHSHYPPGQVSFAYWYYYPNYGVYYQPVDQYYYYSIGGVWRKSTSLPSGWALANEPRVRLRISGVPYRSYDEHRRQYPRQRVVVPRDRLPRENYRRPDHDSRRMDDPRRTKNNRDHKEGKNIFVPHIPEERNDGKYRGREERDKRYSNPKNGKGNNKQKEKKQNSRKKGRSDGKYKDDSKNRKSREEGNYDKDRGKRKGGNKQDDDEQNNESQYRELRNRDSMGRY